MKFILVLLTLISTYGWTQVIDFENVANLEPGNSIGKISIKGSDCAVRFFSGYDLKDTIPLTLQRVAYNAGNGGFYGPKYNRDCTGRYIEPVWINQINTSKYVLDPSISNQKRVGCHFISGILKGEVLPSIFIQYDKATTQCSADLLDVDGHDNTIEAYDIYCYATAEDYPLNPVNKNPVEIRSIGKTTGDGILGDNGGIMPFKIALEEPFTIVEIKPIQQVSGRNDIRNEFGFALDNFSPCTIETAPYIPPYLDKSTNHVVQIEKFAAEEVEAAEEEKEEEDNMEFLSFTILPSFAPVYFGYDSFELSSVAKENLRKLAEHNKTQTSNLIKTIYLSGYTDPKGTKEYNKILSEQRVKAVQSYLFSLGVKPAMIQTSHFGENYSGEISDSDDKKRVVLIRVEG